MFDRTDRIAWNAAYWLLRSEARRQVRSRYPDCDWRLVETHDECLSTIVEAQARICYQAMQRSGADMPSPTSLQARTAVDNARA